MVNIKNIVLILGVISLLILFGCSNETRDTKTSIQKGIEEDGIITFNIIAKNWEFEPNEIIVNKGDNVKLNIKSIDVNHGIAIPDFGISEFLTPGKEVTIEFIADKEGEFRFFCNVFCGEKHMMMKGKIIVKS